MGEQKKRYSIAERWGGLVDSFVPLLDVFVQQYVKLGLDNGDFAIITQLCSFKWSAANPYPSIATLAKRTGLSPRTVQRHVEKLERRGIVKRVPRDHSTNEYDLWPLFEKLGNFLGQSATEAGTEEQTGPEPTVSEVERSILDDRLIAELSKLTDPALAWNSATTTSPRGDRLREEVRSWRRELKERALVETKRSGVTGPILFTKAAQYVFEMKGLPFHHAYTL